MTYFCSAADTRVREYVWAAILEVHPDTWRLSLRSHVIFEKKRRIWPFVRPALMVVTMSWTFCSSKMQSLKSAGERTTLPLVSSGKVMMWSANCCSFPNTSVNSVIWLAKESISEPAFFMLSMVLQVLWATCRAAVTKANVPAATESGSFMVL